MRLAIPMVGALLALLGTAASAAANAHVHVVNCSGLTVDVYAFNGKDQICSVSHTHQNDLGDREVAGLGCLGDGRHRCRVTLYETSPLTALVDNCLGATNVPDGKWYYLCRVACIGPFCSVAAFQVNDAGRGCEAVC